MQLPGHWMVANLQQSIGWSEKAVTVDYGGNTFVLLPEDADHPPGIALRGDLDASRRLILEFVSVLAWAHLGEITVEYWTGGGRISRASKKRLGGQISAMKFEIPYLPIATDAKQKLALALFHEGSGLARIHVAYSFLSFYKIVNLVGGKKGAAQMAWINAHIGLMTHHRSAERLKELQGKNEDIGKYIYKSCRCAIAHAGDPSHPVVDPHDLQDQKRLYADLPLIITLAEIALEKELRIKTSRTVYQEHRYELSGFEPLLGADMVEKLKAGETFDAQLELPHFNVRMCGKAPYAVLSDLIPTIANVTDGVVSIACVSKSARYEVVLVLDFPSYRLKVEIGNAAGYVDDGSVEDIEEAVELHRYFWEFNCNGRLEVWSDEGNCLGRCDAFMPVNVIMNPKGYQNRLDELNAEAAQRRAK